MVSPNPSSGHFQPICRIEASRRGRGRMRNISATIIQDDITDTWVGQVPGCCGDVGGWASRKWVEYFVVQRSLMCRLWFTSLLFTKGPRVLCPSSRGSGSPRRAVGRITQDLLRSRSPRHRRISRLQAQRPTLRTDRVDGHGADVPEEVELSYFLSVGLSPSVPAGTFSNSIGWNPGALTSKV
jgi:hypothetical protein